MTRSGAAVQSLREAPWKSASCMTAWLSASTTISRWRLCDQHGHAGSRADGHPGYHHLRHLMGAAYDALEPLIKQGVIAASSPPAFAAKIGEAISREKFKSRRSFARTAVVSARLRRATSIWTWRSSARDGGRILKTRGAVGGKSDCGVLSYSMADAKYADRRGDYGLPRALPEHARQHFHDGCGLRVRG